MLFRYWRVQKLAAQTMDLRLNRMKPLSDKVEEGISISREDVLPFAEDPKTRFDTYHLLMEYRRIGLFPSKFDFEESATESRLGNWLEFPAALNAFPDQMELVEEIDLSIQGDLEDSTIYYVWKFRVNEPHRAAKKGWMMGVVGPYAYDSNAYDVVPGVFSRLNKFDPSKVLEEVQWVHSFIGTE